MSEDEEISFHKLYPKADNAMRALTMTRAKMELQKSRIPLSQKQLPVNTSLKRQDTKFLQRLDKVKNSHILPTGQWYAPSAVINDALIMQ